MQQQKTGNSNVRGMNIPHAASWQGNEHQSNAGCLIISLITVRQI